MLDAIRAEVEEIAFRLILTVPIILCCLRSFIRNDGVFLLIVMSICFSLTINLNLSSSETIGKHIIYWNKVLFVYLLIIGTIASIINLLEYFRKVNGLTQNKLLKTKLFSSLVFTTLLYTPIVGIFYAFS
jgi:hypothetical protein